MQSMRLCIFLLGVFIISCFTGCGGVSRLDTIAETEEKHYQRAQRLKREGREQEALSAFLKVIEKRRDAPESHLEAGQLYDKHIGDPIASIYHYRKFLELKSDGQQAPMVHQLIESAKKKFARQLPGQPLGNQIDRLDLLDLLEEMRKENNELKKQIAILQAKLERTSQGSTSRQAPSLAANLQRMESSNTLFEQSRSQRSQRQVQPQQPVAERTVPETYTVVAGDSLYSISTKVYGTSSRYMDIFQANRDKMRTPDALTVGLVLRIP